VVAVAVVVVVVAGVLVTVVGVPVVGVALVEVALVEVALVEVALVEVALGEVAVGVGVAVCACAAVDARLTAIVAEESSVMRVRRMPRRTALSAQALWAAVPSGALTPHLGARQGPSVSSVALT